MPLDLDFKPWCSRTHKVCPQLFVEDLLKKLKTFEALVKQLRAQPSIQGKQLKHQVNTFLNHLKTDLEALCYIMNVMFFSLVQVIYRRKYHHLMQHIKIY